MAKQDRARKRRRQEERAARKTVRETERAAAQLPGGDPRWPIEVASASIVEVRARGVACVQCGGALDLRGDRASSTPRGVVRQLDLACRHCHAPRTLWFRVAPPLPS